MPRLIVGDEIECIDNSDTREGNEDDGYDYALSEGSIYTILGLEFSNKNKRELKNIYVEDDFGNREWYCHSYFDLDGFIITKYHRNLPAWF